MTAVTALVGVVFGIAPALQATRIDIGTSLKESSRSVTGSKNILSRSLLVAQVSISLVLLVGAGLFLRTLDNLKRVDIGYDPNNLVFVRTLPNTTEFDAAYRTGFFQQGMERLRSLPGVRAATVSMPTLLSGGTNSTGMFVQGRVPPTGRDRNQITINRVVIAPNFFETMGISLVAGRSVTEHDHAKAPKVAVINQAAARKFFPNENPIGRRFGTSAETSGDIEIVGVLRDVHYNNLRQAPPPTMYVPYAQRGPDGLIFTVRTAGDPAALMPAIRRAVSDINPAIPVVTVETQMSQIEKRFAQEKVLAQAYGLFGGIAVFVAAIGLFGLMSYNVSRRTREIGIRIAMGAQRREVLGLIVRESLVLVIAGIVIGIGVSIASGEYVAVAAVWPGADRCHDAAVCDGGDGGGLGGCRLSARTACNARRSDDCASLRITEDAYRDVRRCATSQATRSGSATGPGRRSSSLPAALAAWRAQSVGNCAPAL